MRMVPGDLVFFGRRPLALFPIQSYGISRTIQKLSGGFVNHVAVASGPTTIIEAEYPCVREREFDFEAESKKNRIFVMRHRLTADLMDPREAITQGIAFLRRELSSTYDVNLIIEMKRALKSGGIEALKQLRINRHDDAYWICSELAVHFLHHAGLEVFTPDMAVPTPHSLMMSGDLCLIGASV